MEKIYKEKTDMKTFKIEIPDGYEIDKNKSTFENIVFKQIKNPMDEVYKYHNTTEEEFNSLYTNLPKHIKAYAKETLIVEFYNKGWKPDWSDNNQKKFYPWFYMDNFYLFNVGYCGEDSNCSERLCFKNSKDCEEAVEKYLDIFKESRMY